MGAINSMTGFGRAETVNEQYRVLAEIKSVNHRYLDLGIKLPRRLNCFEARIRQMVRDYALRGKTDLYISFEDYSENGRRLIYNPTLAAEYIRYLQEMADSFSIRCDISNGMLARFPDVLAMEESSEDDDQLWECVEPVLKAALTDFLHSRESEGEKLRQDLLEKLDNMSVYLKEITEFSPSVVESYRKRLYDKVKETLQDSDVNIDEGRIVTEVVIYADKICTDEEMVRLSAHIDTMKKKLKTGGACGRELDFIAQEMNREANTTLSKANNLQIADTAIALKTEIEKIREQVQNIE